MIVYNGGGIDLAGRALDRSSVAAGFERLGLLVASGHLSGARGAGTWYGQASGGRCAGSWWRSEAEQRRDRPRLQKNSVPR